MAMGDTNEDKKSINNDATGDGILAGTPIMTSNASAAALATENTTQTTATITNKTPSGETTTRTTTNDSTSSNVILTSEKLPSPESATTTITKEQPLSSTSGRIQRLVTVSASATNMGSKMPKDVEDVITYASWPLSCPLEKEEYCISIICGNTRTHWALHMNTNNVNDVSPSNTCISSNANESDFLPTLIWKTIKVFSSSTQQADPKMKTKLVDYIPKAIKDIIYGPDNDDKAITSTTGASSGTNIGGIGGSNTSVLNDPSTTSSCTSHGSATHRSTYRVPGISVYVLSTNDENLKGIAQLFRNSIPCRVVLLTANDFISSSIGIHQLQQIQHKQLQHTEQRVETTAITTDIAVGTYDTETSNTSTFNLTNTIKSSSPAAQSSSNSPPVSSTGGGFYPGMGVDRICGIYAAQYLYETNHVLVIDGGTAMTYTATTKGTGSFYGGGIGPGLRMKFRSLFDYTSALPYITFDILMKYISKQQQHGEKDDTTNRPTSIFATTTQESIIKSVLSETSLHLLKIIQTWLAETTEGTESTSNLPTVVLTGGDIDIFQHLLKPYQNTAELQNVKIVSNRSLLHHGVSAMLVRQRLIKYHNEKVGRQLSVMEQVSGASSTNSSAKTLNEVRDVLMGQRVATIYNPNSSNNAGGISTTTNTGLGEVTTAAIVVGTAEIPHRSTILFGTVVNVINSYPQRTTVDKDYYTIFWDADGSIDDVPPRQLYGGFYNSCFIVFVACSD
jgi:pantothenate kinase type III